MVVVVVAVVVLVVVVVVVVVAIPGPPPSYEGGLKGDLITIVVVLKFSLAQWF